MGFSSYFRRSEKNIALVFDVGSESVGGAVVQRARGDRPTILCSYREPVPLVRAADPEQLLWQATEALKLVARHLDRFIAADASFPSSHRRDFDEIFCVVSPPWYAGKTLFVETREEKPFTVTPAFLQGILEREETALAESFFPLGSEGKARAAVSLLERKIMRLRLNGYETAVPLGKRASHLEISLYLSAAPTNVVNRIASAVRKTFNARQIEFHSLAFVASAMIRDLFAESENFIFADASGELTELSLIERGVVLETASFPSGRNGLIRRLRIGLTGSSTEAALSALKVFARGEGHAKHAEEVERALSEAQAEWLGLFRKTLAHFSEAAFLPRVLYILAPDPATTQTFKSFIEKSPVGQFTVTAEPFTVIPLSAESLLQTAFYATNTHCDPTMTLAALFLNRVHGEEGL